MLIIIVIILIPLLWFVELIDNLKTLDESAELFLSTLFFMFIPTYILGDITSWEIHFVEIGAYIGFTTSSAFHKFKDF